MKLYEYKARAMSILMNYEPRNNREKVLKDMLIVQINNLRRMTMPRLLMDLHLILNHEPLVTDDFKNIIKKLIPKPEEVEKIEDD